MNKIKNLLKNIFDIREGRCVVKNVCIDDIIKKIKTRKEYVFNDRVITIDEYEDFPQSHHV